MGISLVKGQEVNYGLKELLIGFGWDVHPYDGGPELDPAAFLLSENGKCATKKDFIFYCNPEHHSGCMKHCGDDLIREGDAEQILVALSKVPMSVAKIVFTVTIHKADELKQNFSQVNSAFIRIVDNATNQELFRYDFGKDFSSEDAAIVGELYRSNGKWKFNVVGSGFSGGLEALCQKYGVPLR